MRAEVLAIGSELLDPDRTDTNGPYLVERLRSVGIDTLARSAIADDRALLESAFRTALGRAEVVIATGGLGPTEDDLTREAAAAALGRTLVRDAAIVTRLRERFARAGRTMAPNNEQQADVIKGATVLANPNGTAPGQWLEAEGRLLFLLPGPPFEMQPLVEGHVLPLLAARSGGAVTRTRLLRIAGRGESDIDAKVAPLYTRVENPRTTILSAPGEIELRFTARDVTAEVAETRIEDLVREIRGVLGADIYSEDGRSLAEVVAGLLKERGLSLTVAESCTGGLIAGRLTSVAGASTFLDRAFVTYSNQAKSDLLGVDAGLLAEHGAVSEPVARAMAAGVRAAARADIGLAVTGIAGPDGGTVEKPVGLVFIALSGAAGEHVRRSIFPGNRERVRMQTVQVALEMLRRGLLGLPPL